MKYVVHHTGPMEGAAYVAEINEWLTQGYRLKSAGRNYSRFIKGDSPIRAYELGFDQERWSDPGEKTALANEKSFFKKDRREIWSMLFNIATFLVVL